MSVIVKYEKLLNHCPNYEFETFLSHRQCMEYIDKISSTNDFKECCRDQYPEQTSCSIICHSCGMVLEEGCFKFNFPFRNVGTSGHATVNSGVQLMPERRRYKQITNLKAQYKQFMGWRINSASFCHAYNFGMKCIACKNAHKCQHCEGEHRGLTCKNKDWHKKIHFDVNDRNAYAVVREQLRKLKMPWMYKNIYALIYEKGGKKVVHGPRDRDEIIIALIVIQNYYEDIQREDRPAGVYKKRSLGSAKMLLSAVLKMLDKEPFYHLPGLKNKSAATKVEKFFYSFFNDYIAPEFKRGRAPRNL